MKWLNQCSLGRGEGEGGGEQYSANVTLKLASLFKQKRQNAVCLDLSYPPANEFENANFVILGALNAIYDKNVLHCLRT